MTTPPGGPAGPLLTTPQAAQVLRLSRRTLGRLVATGDVPASRIGRNLAISTDALHAYLASIGAYGDQPPALGQPLTDPRLCTPAEAAAVLGVSARSVHRRIQRGQLTAVKVGGSMRIPQHVLDACPTPPAIRGRGSAESPAPAGPAPDPDTGHPEIAAPALEDLTYQWGDLYLISYARDQWTALRRDRRYFLSAATLTGLEHAIVADYRDHPEAHTWDPAGTPGPGDENSITGGGREDCPDTGTLIMLAAMRQTFPGWAISYSCSTRAWIARGERQTIAENSPALLCIALVLIERRQWRSARGPAAGRPPGEDGFSP